jgi:hypothetical protein
MRGVMVDNDSWQDVPVYLNVRDRVSELRQLVQWLELAGYRNLNLLDNDSTYPPLLAYLEQSPHNVVRLGENLGSRALWRAGMVPDDWFIYSDPDLLPIPECPPNVVAHLHRLLMRHRFYDKAALGLYLDDVPSAMQSLGWERSLVHPSRQLSKDVFDSLSDTTFALYRPSAQFDLKALRTGGVYRARHLAWYTVGQPLSAENQYYLDHIPVQLKGPLGSSWAQGKAI